MNSRDKKGILSFLLITFAITYAIEFAVIASGVSSIIKGFGQYVVAVAMWVPAFAAWITVTFITKEGRGSLHMKLGSVKPYLGAALIVPLCFLIIYGLTWALGLGSPDTEMQLLKKAFAEQGAEMPAVPDAAWYMLYASTLLVAPFVNSLFGLGEEIGWRGYLLYRLMPLGKTKAYVILAAVWALWHLPLVISGFMYPGNPLLGNVFFFLLTLSLGWYMNELTLKHDSSVLAGWIHGVFNSQRLGVWVLLFPGVQPLLGGQSGLIGIAVWTLLGFITVKTITRKG